jgi:broad specificity phosphatase PhoE
MLRLHSRVLIVVSLLACSPVCAAPGDARAQLAQPGHVLFLRHANAPGIGDPPGMVLGDCATQRNLDERGRAQAVELGERLRAAGISDVQVYSSQWCRCRETAKLMAIGPVGELPALNSFFEQPETKEVRLKALREFLDALPRDGRPVVFVTHQVTISALTGSFPSSGEGLVLELQPGGGFKRVAEFGGVE